MKIKKEFCKSEQVGGLSKNWENKERQTEKQVLSDYATLHYHMNIIKKKG